MLDCNHFITKLAFSIFTYLIVSLSYANEPISELSEEERNKVILEIKKMRKTREENVEKFNIKEATPEKIQQLFNSPSFIEQDHQLKENALIFAGLGGSQLTFEQPSDIIKKIAYWFPNKLDQAKESGYLWTKINLWGPYNNWGDEQSAFVILWECMPQIAWLHPDKNPYLPARYDGFKSVSGANYPFDFHKCVHEFSGIRTAIVNTNEKHKQYKTEAAERGKRITAILIKKFSNYLKENHCNGSGPNDCVLLLKLWQSLMPTDQNLAKMIQSLEAEVINHDELAAFKLQVRGERFSPGMELVQRQAAFQRIKLQAIQEAPTQWEHVALLNTLNELEYLRGIYKGIRYNLQKPPTGAAFNQLLDGLYQHSNCYAFNDLLETKPELLASIERKYYGRANVSKCALTSLTWRVSKSKGKEKAALQKHYLGMLGKGESGVLHEEVIRLFTDSDGNCSNKDSSWCEKWISKPQTMTKSYSTVSNAKKSSLLSKKELRLPSNHDASAISNVETWLMSLVSDMNEADKTRMQDIVNALEAIGDATWWKQKDGLLSILELELHTIPAYSRKGDLAQAKVNKAFPYFNHGYFDGSRLLIVFHEQSFELIYIPNRLLDDDETRIEHISDIDQDGNFEFWFANYTKECKHDENDLKRTLDCAPKEVQLEMGEVWGNVISFFADTPKRPSDKHKKRNNIKNTKSYNQVLKTYVKEEELSARPAECNKVLVGSILKNKLNLDYSASGEVLSLTCKRHPIAKNQTIVAFFFDSSIEGDIENNEENFERDFAVALIDINKKKVVRFYQDTIIEDASVRIYRSGGINIDTARYKLKPNVRAFGLRMNIGYSPNCAEGGLNSFIWLFVEQDQTLRPVLKDFPTSSWGLTQGPSGCVNYDDEATTIENYEFTLGLSTNSTNGWRDIEVVEHVESITYSNIDDDEKSTKKSPKLYGTFRMEGGQYKLYKTSNDGIW